MIDAKSLTTLEFNKVTALLAAKAVSVPAKRLAAELVPFEDADDARAALAETAEAVRLIETKGALPLGGVSDVRPALSRAAIGGALSMAELLAVAEYIYVCRKALAYGLPDGREASAEGAVAGLFRLVTAETSLENEIRRKVKSDAELFDDASSALADIRRGIKRAGEKIREQLNSIIHSRVYKNALQDSVITTRGGRYCVPVKSEARGAVPGMIHDQSGSGATLYVEPMAVVALNNAIKEFAARERDEIARILAELSDSVASRAESMAASMEALITLDFIFAKGALALDTRSARPEINDGGRVNLIRARHPLIPRDVAVPIDARVGGDFTTLLITGPNTGGKTVALKTIGLLPLMGSAGLFIPAETGSEVAVFDGVFADIGDEQSIEQSLSTFSGHMTNITRVLGLAAPGSLVLLDELCAGTDPTEGAALAESIVERLAAIGARVVVTTHYAELKLYALRSPSAENAACEFDVATLRPTYRLMIGVPGKSNAFAISKRLGLPEDIIETARGLLTRQETRFEDIVTDLEINRRSAETEARKAEGIRREAERLRQEYETAKAKLAQFRDKEMAKARSEAREAVERARDEAAAIVKEMRRLAAENAAPHLLAEKRRELSDALSSAGRTDGTGETSECGEPLPADTPPVPGDIVYARSIGRSARVVTAPDADGDLYVAAGAIKMRVNISSLSRGRSESEDETAAGGRGGSFASRKSLAISPEIDLRGQTIAEAIESVDKYLDDAAMTGLTRVGLIHGKGTGALRNAVTEYLRRHKHVRRYRLGEYGEGDSGVTIVELK
jgi:DNA mismatch repair protein MutS2